MVSLLTGCSTVATIRGGSALDYRFAPYSGTQRNVDTIFNADNCHTFAVFGILDFPFSLALDTVLLPVSIPVWMFSDEEVIDSPKDSGMPKD